MKRASLEKTWVISMWKGRCLMNPTPFLPTALLHCTNVYSIFLCFLDGCQEWKSRNRRPMSITDPWMVMEISTGGLFSSLNTFLPNSCALSQGKWVKTHILNINIVCVKIWLPVLMIIINSAFLRTTFGTWIKLNLEFPPKWWSRYGTMTNSPWMTI